MQTFVPVAKVKDLEPGDCVSVEAAGRWVALFNVNGKIYATDDTCPHAGGPLGEGTLKDEVVVCPWHGWRFNVRTGQRPEKPDLSVACYEVRVVGEEIQVAFPDG